MVGLPPKDAGFNANPALLSMLMMLVTKLTSQEEEDEMPKEVNTGYQPYVSGVG